MWLRNLFEPEPDQWGLRGDPYLWKELREQLGVAPAPDTEQELIALLGQTIEQLIGEPLLKDAQLYVERFAHGGMSSGWVSGEWWLVKGMPPHPEMPDHPLMGVATKRERPRIL